jgi:HEAT repeat protein
MKRTKNKAAVSQGRKSAPAAHAKSRPPDLKLAEGVEGFHQAIKVLLDPSETLARRIQALGVLQSASFGDEDFEAVRGDYVAALRALTADKEIALRQRAFGLLARSGDSYAEKVLMTGLRDPDKAAVPASDALNYLSYNLHSGVQSLARSIFDTSKDQAARQQALRLMSNDPKALKKIQSTLADKKESVPVRQTSAEALHALDPKAYQKWASKAVLDKSENHEVVATSLTALQHFGNEKQIAGNTALRKRLGEMSAGKSPANVRRMAKAISAKYGLKAPV